MTHTTGPWQAGFAHQVIAADGVIAEINPGLSEAAANLALCTAAPDMLAALEGFRLGSNQVVGAEADALILRIPLPVIAAAAAAVEKAKGTK